MRKKEVDRVLYFPERLRKLRDEQNFKQEDVAKKLNITTSAYGFYEQGRNEPSIDTLQKIASIFNVSIDYLLGRIDTPSIPVLVPLTENLQLTKSEIEAIRMMKEMKFLEEISTDPRENVLLLHRYWEFIKKEKDSRK
ncbi:helix-turn-helix transcriptional regulator [Bacillaceae bacterium Marseille-Q3522]|nr:helix-turn-helix transcriptional regulator [Bacillaceae bacterium Marseille-Q3522]